MNFRLAPSSLRAKRAIFALSSAFCLTACPSQPADDAGTGGGDAGLADGGMNPNDPCPAGVGGSVSICQVQNAASPGHKGDGSLVDISGVVALSGVYSVSDNLKGFFAADLPLATYGGVLVTFSADSAYTVNAGDVVNVSGTVQEFSGGAVGSETQVRASSVTNTGGTASVEPLSVTDPSVLADETTGEPYEGVLVQVRNVEVENASLGFGQVQLTGGLVAGSELFSYSFVQGEVLSSLTGVMGYNAFAEGGFRIYPRSQDDIESASKPTVTIPQLRDPGAPGYIAPCASDNFDCAPVQLNNMVVMSETFFISNSMNNGPLFGFFIADPSAVDEAGRALPYSGIQVTISPERSDVTTTYSFAQDADFNWVTPDAAPQPGDVINVNAESSSFFDMAQLRFTSSLEKVGTTDGVEGVTMPLPAQFDGDIADATDPRHPSRLRGGRPAVTVEQGGVARPEEAPDAAVESWEGVLVEFINVDTEQACVAYPYSSTENMVPAYMRDFGYWTVTGGAEIGTSYDDSFGGFWKNVAFNTVDRTCENVVNKCQDSRVAGQTFTSLKGIVNYSFGVYRVNPRNVADIQPPSLFVAEGTGNCN